MQALKAFQKNWVSVDPRLNDMDCGRAVDQSRQRSRCRTDISQRTKLVRPCLTLAHLQTIRHAHTEGKGGGTAPRKTAGY